MAQHDYDIANQSGANFRADLNNALDAIVSNNSGSSEPSTTFAYEWWVDTTNNLLKLRNSANNAWITLPLSITADNSTSGALTVNGNLTTTGTIDVNGQELILDADADTSITADTDDQIDFRLNGADKVIFDTSGIKLIHDDQKGFRFSTANTAESFIDFGDTDNDAIGRISYDHADDSISFRASATQYLKLSAQGTLNFTSPTAFSGQGDGVIGHHSNNYFYINGGTAGCILQDNSGGSNRILLRDSNTIEFEVNGSERMRINSSGYVMINTTSTHATNARFYVGGANSAITGMAIVNDNDAGTIYSMYVLNASNSLVGGISNNGSSTTFQTSSDYRLKENVNYDWDGTEKLKQLKPAQFNFINNADETVEGFIAHETEGVAPYAVIGEKDGEQMQGMDYGRITPILVKAIQELEERVKTLEG